MLTQFLNTPAEEASGMTGFTDADVRAWSEMEISEPSCARLEDGTLTNPKGGVFSPDFSGLSLTDASRTDILTNTRMGHIELPVPVVNIEYVCGREPVLPKTLGLPLKTVKDLMRTKAAVATKDFVSQADGKMYHRGEVIPFLVFSWDPECGAFGGAAVRFLLEEKSVALPGAVMETLPVLPLAFLFGGFKTDDSGHSARPVSGGLGVLYDQIVSVADRLRQYIALDAPGIVIWNEARILQKYVDTLVRNGADGPVRVNARGWVYWDMAHVHQAITGGFYARPEKTEAPLPDLHEKRIARVADRYWEEYEAMEEDTGESVLDPYKSEIKELLAPLAGYVVDRFAASGVSRDRLISIALDDAACMDLGIDSGFQASILSMVCDDETHGCKTDYPRLAETMADRVAYTLDSGLAFRDMEEKKGETA